MARAKDKITGIIKRNISRIYLFSGTHNNPMSERIFEGIVFVLGGCAYGLLEILFRDIHTGPW